MQSQIPATAKPSLMRWLSLFAIAAGELAWMTVLYEAPPLSTDDADWTANLFHFSKDIWPAALWITGACLFILSPRLRIIIGDLRLYADGHRWQAWLAAHALAWAAFAVITHFTFGMPGDSTGLSASRFAGWLTMAGATLGLWLNALAPHRFWLRLLRQEYAALLGGCVAGIGVWILIKVMSRYETSWLGQNEFWNYLGVPTLELVHALLSRFYADLVYQPEQFVLGTASFRVRISYACSGIEGISLITLFLALYLWLFRKEIRFPQAFWLFPLGITAVWLFNAIRIAILIAIGASFSPEIATQGFHAQAGWIFFSLIAVGAITLTNRLRFFTAAQPDFQCNKSGQPLATALLVPLLALMAATMATSAFSAGFDLLYPFRVTILAALLYYFRERYNNLGWTWNWQAPAIGFAVFAVWVLLEPDNGGAALTQGLAALPSATAALWLVFRVLGSVVAVPLAEELAFRGYLIRKLIAKDFENVPLGRFTWFSFLLTSVLFGLLHERWLAGTFAGMGYALALYRRGQLGDAVVAHMTTNALIAVSVLAQAKQSLWL